VTNELLLPRYVIRRGTRGFMVWDREAKGPATFNGYRAVGLTEWQANEIKNELTNKIRQIG